MYKKNGLSGIVDIIKEKIVIFDNIYKDKDFKILKDKLHNSNKPIKDLTYYAKKYNINLHNDPCNEILKLSNIKCKDEPNKCQKEINILNKELMNKCTTSLEKRKLLENRANSNSSFKTTSDKTEWDKNECDNINYSDIYLECMHYDKKCQNKVKKAKAKQSYCDNLITTDYIKEDMEDSLKQMGCIITEKDMDLKCWSRPFDKNCKKKEQEIRDKKKQCDNYIKYKLTKDTNVGNKLILDERNRLGCDNISYSTMHRKCFMDKKCSDEEKKHREAHKTCNDLALFWDNRCK